MGRADKDGVHAGGQDWLAIWRAMYDAERAQGEAATDPDFARHADSWAGRAARFAAASRRTAQPDSFMAWLAPQLHPDDRVIDVGAGSGRYLPYLATLVAEVLAVEPSPAMRAELTQTLEEASADNVRLLDGSWPLAETLAAEVVISAHVVYGVREIGPFLLGIDAAASRLCALYLGLRHPTWAMAPLWERVHGEERLPLPAALETLAACHQLGLPARLDLVPAAPAFRFADQDEAFEEARARLRLTPEPARDALIRAALAELLVTADDGMLAARRQQQYAAVIWWRPEPSEQRAAVRAGGTR
jgi:SAM-dependent methyltransferase